MRISDWSSDVCSSDLTPGRAPILDGALITRANKPKKLVRFIAIMLQFRLKRDHPSLLINGKIAMLGKHIEILLDLLLIIKFKEKVAALESISVKNTLSITHARPNLCRRFPDFEAPDAPTTRVLPVN